MNHILEATAVVRRDDDGWRFAVDFGDGAEVACEDPYPTKEEALAALGQFCDETGALQMTVQ